MLHEAPNGAIWLSPESEPLLPGAGWAAFTTADGTPAYEWVGPGICPLTFDGQPHLGG